MSKIGREELLQNDYGGGSEPCRGRHAHGWWNPLCWNQWAHASDLFLHCSKSERTPPRSVESRWRKTTASRNGSRPRLETSQLGAKDQQEAGTVVLRATGNCILRTGGRCGTSEEEENRASEDPARLRSRKIRPSGRGGAAAAETCGVRNRLLLSLFAFSPNAALT